jgi:AcrR family transcriptional regulator
VTVSGVAPEFPEVNVPVKLVQVGKDRGRPRDPAVGRAALRETLALLDEHGYERLRVADVARNAGIGLGSLYRRWPTKYDLVVEALCAATSGHDPEPTGDPLEDLVARLVRIADAFGRSTALLSVLFSAPQSELAAAVREAKVEPVRAEIRELLRRAVGPVSDLDVRADVGPALIIMHLVAHGSPPDEPVIRSAILPVMLAGALGT